MNKEVETSDQQQQFLRPTIAVSYVRCSWNLLMEPAVGLEKGGCIMSRWPDWMSLWVKPRIRLHRSDFTDFTWLCWTGCTFSWRVSSIFFCGLPEVADLCKLCVSGKNHAVQSPSKKIWQRSSNCRGNLCAKLGTEHANSPVMMRESGLSGYSTEFKKTIWDWKIGAHKQS